MRKLEIRGELFENQSLKNHNFLHLGGNARYFCFVDCPEDLMNVLNFAEEKGMPYYILGKGSNVLFLDCGFQGVVITTERMNSISSSNNCLTVDSGALLNEVINFAGEKDLRGIERLFDIPGTIGGAAIMNAGAYGCEVGNWISSVRVLRNGEIKKLDDVEFNYRDSSLRGEIVLSVELQLKRGNFHYVRKKTDEIRRKREKSLPDYGKDRGTCGSTFKNPVGGKAAVYIEKAGLKGKRIGGAFVSEKHANFLMTENGASSADYLELMKLVIDEVDRKFGVRLKPEVKIIGKEEEVSI